MTAVRISSRERAYNDNILKGLDPMTLDNIAVSIELARDEFARCGLTSAFESVRAIEVWKTSDLALARDTLIRQQSPVASAERARLTALRAIDQYLAMSPRAQRRAAA